ncbi:MSHA biogenesis protein MshQ [Rheinheimera pacifica]|uniref:DUF6701 domain-containing protein n=1 Tax=Rheinheimera pacifica TaxID=173990 RepID=UPI0028620B6F|nr:DUF6701 domain-containing protein [Rheinheimera pacifica]MDR6984223.1 MSHA biogenesis protein MshQ [Rheinheimera pacifica]
MLAIYRFAMLCIMLLPVGAYAATYTMAQGSLPPCSTSWSVNVNTYTCTGDGRVTLAHSDIIAASAASITLIAANGVQLGTNVTLGSNTNRVNLQAEYGTVVISAGVVIWGNVQTTSGAVSATSATINGNVQTNNTYTHNGGVVNGTINANNGVTLTGVAVSGTVTANSDVNLTGGSVAGRVTSSSNKVITNGTNLADGATTLSGFTITGGTITGSFVLNANNVATFTGVTMTSGSISGASTITINNSQLGSSGSLVTVSTNSNEITLSNNSVVYGVLTAANNSTVNVQTGSQVYGQCLPNSTPANACTPYTAPRNEYRFDQLEWTGAAAEVLDSIGNNHGTAFAAQTSAASAGQICRAGEFNGSSYVTVPDLSVLTGTASLSFWIKTTATGNDTVWQAPAVTGVEQSGGADDIFWGWIDSQGRIGLTKGDYNSAVANTKSSIAINNGQFRHVVLTRNAGTGAFQIFIDGALNQSGSYNVMQGTVGNLFNDIGRVRHTNGTSFNYLNATLDEVLVYNSVLDSQEVQRLYTVQREKRDLGGEVRQCPQLPLQCLADSFTGTLSDSWITARSSGTFTPSVVNGRLRMTQNVGNQSTSVTYQRLYPAANNLVVVEFDYLAYGGNGADGMALVLSDATVTPQPGAFGGPLGYGFKPGIPGFSGGWLGFGLDEYGNYSAEGGSTNVGRRQQSVVVRGSGSGTTGYRYLRGTCNNGTTNTNGNCLTPAVDGNQNNPHRYRFTIDSRQAGSTLVSVDRNTGNGFVNLIAPFNAQGQTGQAPVPENFFVSITGSTGGSNNIHELDNLSICAQRSMPVGQQINHIELTHQAAGIACVASAVQVKACLNADCSTLFTSPVSVDLSNSAGNWQTDPITLTNGVGTAYLRHPAGGVATIGVTETVPPRKAFSQTVCKVGNNSSNCQINFANAGLLFAQADGVTPLSHQTAGVAFNGVLRAIRTNTTTGACEARTSGSQTVRLGFSCENPSSCIAGQQFSINNTPIAANGAASSTNRSNVNLTFNSSGSAPITMRYTDVGQLALHASLVLAEQSPDPAITLNGSSNAFVVRPHTLAVVQALRQNGSANPATQTGGNGFVAAGEPFNMVVEARNADGQATPNFGKELNRQRVEAVFNQLVYPSSGNNGTLNGGVVDTATAALNGRQTVTGVSWNEAGSITLRAKLLNDIYLGVADISAKPVSETVGRFYPDNFALASSEVRNSCTNFSYMSQPALTVNYQLEAKGRGGNTLQNYHSGHYPAGAATMLTVAQDNSTRLAAERLAVQAAQWQHGVYRVQQNNVSFNRAAVPDGPYSNMQLGLQIVSEQDSRNFPAFTLGTDALALSGTLNMRYGRLVLQNSGGPEDEPVPLAFNTEYWQGGRFINNIDDNCSVISNSSALLSTISGTPALSMTGVGGVVQTGRFPAQSLTLAPPGIPGVWQVEYMAEPWLQYYWRGASANYQQNPQAEIMFGRFRGNPRQIFWRELFR